MVSDKRHFLKDLEHVHGDLSIPYRVLNYVNTVYTKQCVLYRPPSNQNFAFDYDTIYNITLPHEYFIIDFSGEITVNHFYNVKRIKSLESMRPLKFMTNHNNYKLCLNMQNSFGYNIGGIYGILKRYFDSYWGVDYINMIARSPDYFAITKILGMSRDDIISRWFIIQSNHYDKLILAKTIDDPYQWLSWNHIELDTFSYFYAVLKKIQSVSNPNFWKEVDAMKYRHRSTLNRERSLVRNGTGLSFETPLSYNQNIILTRIKEDYNKIPAEDKNLNVN